MDLSKENEILATIKEDHELVVEQLRILGAIKDAVAGAKGAHLERVLDLLRQSSQFFQSKLLPHFEREEHGLFLLFRTHLPKGSTLVYELESEHAAMRELCDRLRSEVALLRHGKYRRPQLLSELQTVCTKIAELLRQHADRETTLIEHYLIPADREEPGDQSGDELECISPHELSRTR